MPKATSNPAEIQKLDRKRQVLAMLHQGFDIRAICDQVDLDEVYVRTLAREEMQYLDLATQEMQQHFVAMTFARSERIMSRILPDFEIDPPLMPDTLDEKILEKWNNDVKYWRRMIGESLKNWALVTRVQKEVLQVKGVAEKKPDGMSVENMAVTNITITAESDFYREALDSMQSGMFGETFAEMQTRFLEEGDIIQLPDDRLDKIEKAIEKLNVPNDTPQTTDDE